MRALASAGVRLESAAAAVTEESLTADESGSLRLCIVCFAEPKTHLAYPCGHQSVCGTCSAQLKSCPICRAAVAGWIRVRVA